jgi:glycosyltransferase involved in cell wall biosynthesis
VCLVAPIPPPYGGIAHWAQLLLRYAATRPDVQFDVVDIAPRWRAIHDLALWKRVVGGGAQLLRDVARFLWTLLRRRPDAVHLTTSGQLAILRDLAFGLVAAALRVPVVYHLRFGRVPEIARANTREWRLLRRAMARAARVIPIDLETEQAIRTHAPEVRVERVPNCVNPAELPSSPSQRPSRPTVMYLGWVIPTKGIAELVEAWARLAPTGWRLLAAGPGDEAYRRALLDRFQPAGIEFPGELGHDEAMREMAAADVFVLPSYTEGFPNVVLEAMTLGKAIVATEVGAIPEMLAGGAGLTVPPRSVDALTTALGRVLSDGVLRQELGGRASERALSEYAIDVVFERYKRIWMGKAVVET